MIYDLEYKTGDGRMEGKLLFVFYSPDACSNGGERFKYANGKEAVKSKCQPTNREFQINDYADLKEAEWIEECS